MIDDHHQFFMKIAGFPVLEGIWDSYILWHFGDPRAFVFHNIKFWQHDKHMWYNHGTSRFERPYQDSDQDGAG